MGIRTYRSRLDWDVGYFATRRLALRTLGGLQIGHSGLQVGIRPREILAISQSAYRAM